MKNEEKSTAFKNEIRYYTISNNIDVETGEIIKSTKNAGGITRTRQTRKNNVLVNYWRGRRQVRSKRRQKKLRGSK